MSCDIWEKVKLVELKKDKASLPTLHYRYKTSEYYDFKILRKPESWRIKLALKPLEKTLEKNSESKLFEAHIEEPRVFAAELDGE